MRLNMQWLQGSPNHTGKFTVTRQVYARTDRTLRVFDFDAAPRRTANDFLRVVRNKRRHLYRMTTNGVGCRFWQ